MFIFGFTCFEMGPHFNTPFIHLWTAQIQGMCYYGQWENTSFFLTFFFYVCMMYMCTHVHMSQGACMKVREQLGGVSFLLPPCGFGGLNSALMASVFLHWAVSQTPHYLLRSTNRAPIIFIFSSLHPLVSNKKSQGGRQNQTNPTLIYFHKEKTKKKINEVNIT